jgi:hypothetical protein
MEKNARTNQQRAAQRTALALILLALATYGGFIALGAAGRL